MHGVHPLSGGCTRYDVVVERESKSRAWTKKGPDHAVAT